MRVGPLAVGMGQAAGNLQVTDAEVRGIVRPNITTQDSKGRPRGLLPAKPGRSLLQAMDSAAQRGKLRKPGTAGAGAAVGAEDILFLVRKVQPGGLGWVESLGRCRTARAANPPVGHALMR
jgi:hypothetical protein